MGPSHCAAPVNGEGTAHLPARTALSRSVPDAFVFSQAENRVDGARTEDMPCVGNAKSPLSIEIAFLVDENINAPYATDLRNPFLSGFSRRVRDCDAVHFFVLGRYRGESLERLLGNCKGSELL